MITLLQAQLSDIPQIFEMAKSIWNDHYPAIIGQEQVDYMLGKMYSAESLAHQMTEENQPFYFIIENEKKVGFISVSEKEKGCLFIHKFYVLSDIQSKGIGEQVIRLIEEKWNTVHSMILTVNRKNFKAINFYFKTGFKIDYVADFNIGDGYEMNDFVMKKIILK